MSKSKFIIQSMFLCVILYGCSENVNNIYIIDENCTHNKDTTHTGTADKSASRIIFSASVESVNSTKSISIMGVDEIASIYSYPGNPIDLSNPLKSVNYRTTKPGLLAPIKQDTLFLSNGKYSFYSISTNSAKTPPAFVNGYSEPLMNGVDYLWWRVVNYEIKAPLVIIPIYYTHSATQIVVKLTAGKGITIDELIKSEIRPSASGASMNEATGIIPQTDRYSTEIVIMGRNDLYSQYTMLPVKSDKPMEAYFTVKINNELSERVYKINIPLPKDGLEGGKSYLFEAIIDANIIEFKQVNIIDWVVVDQTGSPLYPSQI